MLNHPLITNGSFGAIYGSDTHGVGGLSLAATNDTELRPTDLIGLNATSPTWIGSGSTAADLIVYGLFTPPAITLDTTSDTLVTSFILGGTGTWDLIGTNGWAQNYILQYEPTIRGESGVNQQAMGFASLFNVGPTFTPRGGATMVVGDVSDGIATLNNVWKLLPEAGSVLDVRQVACMRHEIQATAGTTILTNYGFIHLGSQGADSVGNDVALYIPDDPGTDIPTGVMASIRAQGADRVLRHRGPGVFGADANPTGAFLLEVIGDARIDGKLTVTGVIDPTQVIIQNSNTLAPLVVDSTILCTNLNADMVDGLHAASFQAADADLTAIAALSGTGLLAHTGAGTWAERSLTAPAAGITISNPAGLLGDPTFALANDLLALEGLGSTGIAVRTGTDAWAQRSIAVTDSSSIDFTLTNPAGIAGDPTITAVVLPAGVDHNSTANLTVGDVHTQYALLAGRSTGQTLIGGTGSGENLTLQSTAHATHGRVKTVDALDVVTNASVSYTAAFTGLSLMDADFTIGASGSVNGLLFDSLITIGGTPGATGAATLFNFNSIITNTASTARTLTGVYAYAGLPTIRADGAAFTVNNNSGGDPSYSMLLHNPVLSRINSGTGTAQWICGMESYGTVNTGWTVTDWTTVSIFDIGGSGTLTNLIGVDIAKLTKGATINLGIRNASSTAFTPSASQTISAAGNTIVADATVVIVSNTTAGAITLTSAPTIANGQNGQMLYIMGATGSTQNIVVQDQGTLANSNLRLGATTRTITARDFLILMYSSNVGDWVEVGFNTVI